jgi:hypothetical protein
MSVITLNDNKGGPPVECVVGLKWETVKKKDWKKRKATARVDNIAYVELPVTRGDLNTVNVGVIDEADVAAGKAKVSLGAWLANTFKSGLIVAVERVSDDEVGDFWYCVVRDGQVISGTDAIGSWDVVDAQISEILEMIAASDTGFIGIHASSLTANVSPDSDPSPLATALNKSAVKKSQINTKETAKQLRIAGMVAIVLIVVASSVVLFFTLVSTPNTDAIERSRQQKITQRQAAEREYANLREQSAARTNGGSVIELLVNNHLALLETKLGGWLLEGGECNATNCTLEFNNEDLTDPSILLAGASNVCKQIDIDISGTSGACTFSIAGNDAPEGAPSITGFMTELDVDQLRSALMRYARNFDGAAYSIEKPSDVMFKGSQHLRDKNLLQQGSWAIGFPIKQARQVIEILKQHKSLTVDQIKINWGAKTAEAKGLYFKEGDSL